MDVRHLASLDAANVLHEQIVVALHFVRRLPADGPGDIVPAVGGILVVHREGPLERLVLLSGPTRCHLREWRGVETLSELLLELIPMEKASTRAVLLMSRKGVGFACGADCKLMPCTLPVRHRLRSERVLLSSCRPMKTPGEAPQKISRAKKHDEVVGSLPFPLYDYVSASPWSLI
ncbi:hypothetical protein B296_00002951 [Ensete ventricosum]|uniref:Uncharacterized protein n=1 Tax=Ensete ventricosum TaxID=4639 RepID=A0A427ABT9_ENSVE|nr:hypothetical protein B296_00002951 [Ensete ventricosum]